MILFLFNNVDPFVCKKLAHFIFVAFEKRERTLNIGEQKHTTRKFDEFHNHSTPLTMLFAINRRQFLFTCHIFTNQKKQK